MFMCNNLSGLLVTTVYDQNVSRRGEVLKRVDDLPVFREVLVTLQYLEKFFPKMQQFFGIFEAKGPNIFGKSILLKEKS